MITSVQNAKIKMVRELSGAKKHREQKRTTIIEGVRLAEEALSARSAINLCLFSNHVSDRGKKIIREIQARSYDTEEVSADLMDRISDTRTSQGILLAVPYPEPVLAKKVDPVIILDNIRDPGNMGTILRTAAALDFGMVILTTGTTDPFSPKVMRSAMGAQFHLPIRWMGAKGIYDFCKDSNGIEQTIFLADANSTKSCWETDLSIPACIVIGGEADGISTDIMEIGDDSISIPMGSLMESINAAMSASILMYEINRQRIST